MTADTAVASGFATRAWVQQIMGLPISVHVRAHDTGRADIARAVDAVFAHLRSVDAVFSTWNPDSEIMRVRDGRLRERDAHPWFGEVRAICADLSTATGGLFTTDLVGPDGTRGFDPTGMVKGWAIAGAAAYLRALNRVGFSVNAGGDILCGLGAASSASATPWRVGVEHPTRPGSIARVVEIVEGAIATSSSSARGAHIIDPRTGSPILRSSSSTVVGPDIMWADVGATVTFIDPSALASRPRWTEYAVLTTGTATTG